MNLFSLTVGTCFTGISPIFPTVKSHEHSRLGCQEAQDEFLQKKKKEAQDDGFSIVGKFFSFPFLHVI